ncbi:Hypothetical predicted protein [Mytilus galloprovincialis]|uniref:Uncharacterized protein n=1 Tax=Mytilus galloprovincialis TaxID=29158 RepID=A0A8B6BNF7_MYTGA|nr:Hypothetical predicted protein [Mytilus galloprovincialis]
MFPNERVFISESGNTPADNASICSTFCHYTDSPTIRTLRRQGSSVNLPSNVSLCEPCGSACKEATTIMTSIETTRTTSMPFTSIDIDSTTYMTATETTQKISVQSDSTDIDSTIKIISTTTTPKTTLPATATEMDTTIQLTSTETTQTTVVHSSLKVTTTDLKDETTLDTKSTDAGCVLPEDLKNTAWEYRYTDVASSLEQTTILNIANATLPDSIISFNANNVQLTTTMMTSLDTTQITTLASSSTEIDITTEITSTEKAQQKTILSTSTEIDTSTDVISTETTQITTLPAISTEIDPTTEMTLTTTPETTSPTTSTPTEMESITELIPTTTAPKTTLHTTSTEMDTTILKWTSTDTTQTTVVHSTVTDLKTSIQRTISSTSTNTETTTELKETTTDLKDETTLQTKLTDKENLKRYSGPITLMGISCTGLVLVIIVFCLLKGTSKNSTEEIANTEVEKAYGTTPENCYKLYKGKEFGLQEIAIRHWDYH